jgi:hypothetical protein
MVFSSLTASIAEDREIAVSAGSTQTVHQIIRDLYLEVLHREPDESGLQAYTRSVLQEGRDAVWLRRVLRDSDEGRRLRFQARRRTAVLTVVLAIVLSATFLTVAFRGRLRRLSGFLREKFSTAHALYLGEAVSVSPVATVLALLYLYTSFRDASLYRWILCGLILVVFLIAARVPRWICYAAVICGMIALIALGVFVDANGRQDATADRDDAVEVAANALLAGNNPWSCKTPLGLPITTGPSSILLALPFVRLFGQIHGLSFIMWLVFIGILAFGDIRRRNNTFLTVCLLLLFRWFGFLHTLHWSLDELYYAAILSPLLWLSLIRGRFGLVGVVGGFMVLSRLSYAPAVLASGLWWLLRERRSFRSVRSVALGGAAFAAAVIGLFWMVGGQEFLHANFWTTSQMGSLSSHGNPVTALLSSALRVLPAGPPGSMIVVFLLTALAALAMRRCAHPFYHMAVASLFAHTIAFSPDHPRDYQLAILIPALYGLCFWPHESLTRDAVTDTAAGHARQGA